MTRVLYFIESMGKGGKERRLYELIRVLEADRNFKLYLLTFRPNNDFPGLNDLLKGNYWITNIHNECSFITVIRCFKYFWKSSPDIVHTWGPLNSLVAVLFKPIFRYRIVNSQITAAPKDVSVSVLFNKIPFMFSNIVVSNSFAGLTAYKAPKQNSKVIYNGFDFRRIHKGLSKEDLLKKYRISSELVVGMFSNLSPAKDYQLFFTIAQEVLNKREDVTFICAGRGDFSKFQNRLSGRARSRINIFGPVEEVEEIMSVCDLGLQLTNTVGHGEGISNSILELCALGKCVVATNCGGTPEIIVHGVNGFLVGSDSAQISELIELLLDDKETRDKTGAKAKEVAKEKFGIEKMADQFVSIYLDQS